MKQLFIMGLMVLLLASVAVGSDINDKAVELIAKQKGIEVGEVDARVKSDAIYAEIVEARRTLRDLAIVDARNKEFTDEEVLAFLNEKITPTDPEERIIAIN